MVHFDMSGRGVGGGRHNAEGKPNPAVGSQGKGSQLMVNENWVAVVENMKIV